MGNGICASPSVATVRGGRAIYTNSDGVEIKREPLGKIFGKGNQEVIMIPTDAV